MITGTIRGVRRAMATGTHIYSPKPLKERLHEFEIVIVSTGAQDYILSYDDVRAAYDRAAGAYYRRLNDLERLFATTGPSRGSIFSAQKTAGMLMAPGMWLFW